MERDHQTRNRSARGSGLPPNRRLASEPHENNSIQGLNQIPLGKVLVEKFPDWLAHFERHGPFGKRGQLEYHVETISRRNELGSAAAAVTDELFLRGLYNTLRAWGIGVRRSQLKPFDEFAAIFGAVFLAAGRKGYRLRHQRRSAQPERD